MLLWLKAAWGWLKRNWKWLLFPVGFLLFLIGRFSKKTRTLEVVSSDLHEHDKTKDKIDEQLEKDVKKVETEKAEKIQEIEREHSEAIKKLTDEQKKEADGLRQDPDALARYLIGVGKDIRDGR